MKEGEAHYAHGAMFRVMDAPDAHEEIVRETGLQPSHSHKPGDVRSKTKNWDNAIWMLESPLPDTDSLSAHLRWLRDELEPHRDYFCSIRDSGVKMDVYCRFRADVDTGGFSIAPDALKIATDFELPLEVSVFFE